MSSQTSLLTRTVGASTHDRSKIHNLFSLEAVHHLFLIIALTLHQGLNFVSQHSVFFAGTFICNAKFEGTIKF